MSGFTDSVFRQLCKEQGTDVVVTEFVLADSMVRGDDIAWKGMDFTPEQRPIGVQIFGCDSTVHLTEITPCFDVVGNVT